MAFVLGGLMVAQSMTIDSAVALLSSTATVASENADAISDNTADIRVQAVRQENIAEATRLRRDATDSAFREINRKLELLLGRGSPGP